MVVGHSLGGGIALRAALNEPNRFAGLILAAPVSTTGLDFLPDGQFVTLSHRPGLGRRATISQESDGYSLKGGIGPI